MTSVTYYPGYSQVQVKENLRVRDILEITQAFPAILTTVVNHGYVVGMIVTFLISTQFGMTELNGKNVQILSLTSNSLTLDIDTREFTPFAYPNPLPSAYTPPTVIPNSSGPYLSPIPLPYANQDSFEGIVYNNGTSANPVNGIIS